MQQSLAGILNYAHQFAEALVSQAHTQEQSWIVSYIADCDPQDSKELLRCLNAIVHQDAHRPKPAVLN